MDFYIGHAKQSSVRIMSRFRVLLVCNRDDDQLVRSAIREHCRAAVDVTGEPGGLDTSTRYDWVVGVPGEADPVAFALRLDAAYDAPVVLAGAIADELVTALSNVVTAVVPSADPTDERQLVSRLEAAFPTQREPPLVADGGQPSPDSVPTQVADPLARVTDGFLALDEDWVVTYLNDAAREMLGEAAESLPGSSLWETLPEAAGTTVQTEFQAAMDDREARTVEEYLPGPDSWLEIRIYPANDGLSVLFRDVTDRRRAREELEVSENSLQRLHELASDTDLEPMEKVSRILEVGRERLDVDIGFLSRIEDGTQEIIASVGNHSEIQPGSVAPLEEAYCRRTVGREDPLAVDNAIEEGWGDDPAYERFGLACYLGATISVDGEEFGTVCFADTGTRGKIFSEAEETFIDLVTDWVSFVLTRREYEETLRARERQLSGIVERSRSLMQARSREEVAQLMAAAARDILGYEYTVVRLYDADDGTLRPAGSTQAADQLGDRPVYEVGEGLPGEVFATGESRVVDDLSGVERAPAGLGSAMYYPVGVHGTVSVGAPEQGAFDDRDRQVLGLLATSAAAANTRAKREREVREAREHVETVLERVNGIVENTVEVLVSATARDELETEVAEVLAGADPYVFAWMGRPDLASETLSPSAWAGDASVPATDVSFSLDGDSAVARAYHSEQLQVLDDVSATHDDGLCAGTTSCAAVESAIVVPLTYKDTSYGVLAVFADEPGAFDEREQVILGALGGAIANAINAVERGRILDADEVIEVEFAIGDPDLLFNRLSREADRVASAGTDYRADGTLTMYLTAEGGDGDSLLDIAREDDRVLEATVLTDHEGSVLLEATVEESLVATLSEYGAVTTGVVAESGTTRFTVELPYEAEARDLYDLVENRYPGTDLVGYHEHERPIETRQEFRAALADRFTDRQETALRTAFLGGFFEWPRNIDGNELADAMDISRPTYHQHLRAAQKKVLEELFDQST